MWTCVITTIFQETLRTNLILLIFIYKKPQHFRILLFQSSQKLISSLSLEEFQKISLSILFKLFDTRQFFKNIVNLMVLKLNSNENLSMFYFEENKKIGILILFLLSQNSMP